MRVIPHFTADFDEYPELRTIAPVVIRRVAELMELHDIAELKRIRKAGIFEHPYCKDVVRAINAAGVPASITASRYTAGIALLDYLEAVGMNGIGLELTKEDIDNISGMWTGQYAQKDVTPKEGVNSSEDNHSAEQQEQHEVPADMQNEPAKEEEHIDVKL